MTAVRPEGSRPKEGFLLFLRSQAWGPRALAATPRQAVGGGGGGVLSTIKGISALWSPHYACHTLLRPLRWNCSYISGEMDLYRRI